MTVQEKFENARLKLFNQKLMFFGLSASKLIWSASELHDNVEGCVYFDVNKKDETVDRCIHINKKYLLLPDYKTTNLVDLIIHEILHILHRHHTRGTNKRPEIWALATDHVIDRTLKSWSISEPYHQYNIIDDLNSALPKCTEEEAYDWLYNNRSHRIKYQPGQGNGEAGVSQLLDNSNNIIIQSIVPPNSQQGVSEQQLIDKDIDNFVAEARATHQTLKDRGLDAGHLSEHLDKLLAVEIPWDTIFRKAIKTNTIQKPNDRSWVRPNKFLRPLGFYLPGTYYSDDKEGLGVLVLHVDSSGSMSTNDLKKGAHVIMESIQYFAKIIVLVGDTRIHQTKEFWKEEFTPFYQFIKDGMKGRGGTSHKPIFEWCQNHIWDDDPDNFSLFISFSDCMSDIETYTHTAPYSWTKHIPSIYLSPKNGTTIDIDKHNVTQIFIN